MEKVIDTSKEKVVCNKCGSSDLIFIDTAILKGEDTNYYYYEIYACQKCGRMTTVPIKQVPTAMVEGLV